MTKIKNNNTTSLLHPFPTETVIPFLKNKQTPFYTLPELEVLLSSFQEHLEKGRNDLITNGKCRVSVRLRHIEKAWLQV
jgi:hypothetical protein